MQQGSENFTVTVRCQRRIDGGLRVWSDDVPGLVLSNRDPKKVMADLQPALEFILSEKLGCAVKAEPIHASRFERVLPPRGLLVARRFRLFEKLQFSATPCAA